MKRRFLALLLVLVMLLGILPTAALAAAPDEAEITVYETGKVGAAYELGSEIAANGSVMYMGGATALTTTATVSLNGGEAEQLEGESFVVKDTYPNMMQGYVLKHTPTELGIYTYEITISVTNADGTTEKKITYTTEVKEPFAMTPVIQTQPKDACCEVGDVIGALSVSASVTDGGTLSYEWFSSDDDETYIVIENETSNIYVPDVSERGVTYYRCEITNTRENVDEPAVVQSASARIIVRDYSGNISGDGTAAVPYVITNETELFAIAKDMDAYYVLSADIAPETWIAPISTTEFKGTLNGNGYTITLPSGATAGLFGATISGTIENLKLVAPSITSDYQSSGLLLTAVGAMSGISGTIRNCAVIGAITTTTDAQNSSVGGFAGVVGTNASIINSYSAVAAAGSADFEGAIAGIAYGTLTNCLYDSDLTAAAIESGSATATGLTTADLKAAAATLNTNLPAGLLAWEDVSNDYPDFASHTEVLAGDISISGTLKSGETLTVNDTLTTPSARVYEWYRVGADGTAAKVTGETADTYALTDADVGFKMRVRVTTADTIGNRTAETATRIAAFNTVQVTFTVTPADAKLIVLDGAGAAMTLENNVATLPSTGNYYYTAGKDGYEPQSGAAALSGNGESVSITLTERTATGWSSDKSGNMQIGDLSKLPNFPTSHTGAKLKWASEVGHYPNGVGADGEVTNVAFVDGAMFVVGGEGGKQHLYKINPETGEKLAKVQLTNQGGYYYFLSSGEGKIFFRENGCVEAFDTNLTRLWKNTAIDVPYNYGTPITYSDGFIYFGTAASSRGLGGYYCLSAADGTVIWYNETELSMEENGSRFAGHYWAGACVIGDYVVYGSEGGRVYSVNKLTGEIANRLDAGEGIYADAAAGLYEKPFVRSSIAYADGMIYFTSTDGYVHSAEFNSTTGAITNHKSALIGTAAGAGGNDTVATGTPVVYNGRLYTASSAYFAVFDAATLNLIYRTPHTGLGMLRDLRLVADDVSGSVYVFTTYNRTPGSIVMFKDEKNQSAPSGYSDFAALTDAHAEFGAAMPIFGEDGTIYFTNDRGDLMALQNQFTVYISLSGADGKYMTGSDAAQTVLNNVPVAVSDLDSDGSLTIEDAMLSLHSLYSQNNTSDYTRSVEGWITKFWGVSSPALGYRVNNVEPDSEKGLLNAIESGDSLSIYFYQDTNSWSDIYTYFSDSEVTAYTNQAASFTVNGSIWSGAVIPAGATISVTDSEGTILSALAATVGADGKFSITFPETGKYTVMVSGKTTDDVPVVPSVCTVTVKEKSSAGTGKISVKFRLIGATLSEDGVDIENGIDDSKYVTWIATKSYTLDAGETVHDLFMHALDAAGLSYNITSSGSWVDSITAPKSLGGYELATMDNGTYSGWMYSVNGVHVQNSLDNQTLKNGDVVIWHYINDYRYEDSQWATGSMGDASYWDRWLKAKDVNPENAEEEAGATAFKDVPAGVWYADAVARMAEQGLIAGTSDDTFSPNVTMNRAMFVTILGRLHELEHKISEKAQNGFGDVVSGSYYEKYVAWGVENQLVMGISAERFAPGHEVTREQLVVFLYRYAKLLGLNVSKRADLSKYSDLSTVSDYAAEAMAWAVGEGLITGTSATRLNPSGTATRAQAAVFIDRFMAIMK